MQDLIFSSSIKRLEAAFRHPPLSQATLELYFEKLKAVDDKKWLNGVEEIIDEEDFFPSIHSLRKHCRQEKSYDAAGRVLKVL